jgi:hypothetical protein
VLNTKYLCKYKLIFLYNSVKSSIKEFNKITIMLPHVFDDSENGLQFNSDLQYVFIF